MTTGMHMDYADMYAVYNHYALGEKAELKSAHNQLLCHSGTGVNSPAWSLQ